MDAIGGYFEFELRSAGGGVKNAIRLNSGRNCFEYILLSKKYRRVYMPYYTCQVMFDTAKRLNVEVVQYRIDELLEPIELPRLKENEAFVYTNYYGLKQRCVEQLAEYYGNRLIVDNAQAFYAKRLDGIDTFYSPRKFFGVPDGGYLYTDTILDKEFPQAQSIQRMTHLIKRIELGAEAGYEDYIAANKSLNRPIERMSKITERILGSIDYDAIAQCRRQNYKWLNEHLHKSNLIHFELYNDAVPLVYPYLTEDPNLKSRLIANKIFVATYWPNIEVKDSLEAKYKTNLLPLPIDQRYSNHHLEKLLKFL